MGRNKSEWEKMRRVWRDRLSAFGLEACAVCWKAPEPSGRLWTACLALAEDRVRGNAWIMLTSRHSFTADGAYADLLRQYGNGEHLQSNGEPFARTGVPRPLPPSGVGAFFPPCSSAAELRLRLEVAGVGA